jgi:hypothetical protein
LSGGLGWCKNRGKDVPLREVVLLAVVPPRWMSITRPRPKVEVLEQRADLVEVEVEVRKVEVAEEGDGEGEGEGEGKGEGGEVEEGQGQGRERVLSLIVDVD